MVLEEWGIREMRYEQPETQPSVLAPVKQLATDASSEHGFGKCVPFTSLPTQQKERGKSKISTKNSWVEHKQPACFLLIKRKRRQRGAPPASCSQWTPGPPRHDSIYFLVSVETRSGQRNVTINESTSS